MLLLKLIFPYSKYYHMSSFGETKTESILAEADSATKFVDYNTRQISRIYPGAARQDSSNLKILPPWNAGCQIGNIPGVPTRFAHQECRKISQNVTEKNCESSLFQWP